MGITGLLPFIEKASRRTNVNEFNGCTVAIDSYCWLHKGAFACADRLVRGEETDVHIKYCLKYVTMLLSNNIKPILVFDGRHLPAKAMTESKRRESRQISKKRAAELLSLGKVEEARSYIRRAVDITHEMALALIQECRKRNVDCIVAPYEADAQLAYLNMKNIAQLVITEDSDLILFGCTKVLFKMDLNGTGTLVETAKLPLIMRCPIESYSFAKFRRMCILSGCDYLSSLPGVGLAKARQFVLATQDPDFTNALKKLPSYLNRPSLTVSDEYRESFLKAEATFKHQYVYDPLQRQMVRLTDTDDEDVEQALCVNAGELLKYDIAFQLALGNLDPFTLRKMDDWHPDTRNMHNQKVQTNSWKEKVPSHPSIWDPQYEQYLGNPCPWQKEANKTKPDPIISNSVTRPRKKVVNMIVPETQDDDSLSIQTLSNMYCIEPSPKKQKANIENEQKSPILTNDESAKPISNSDKSPILENKQKSFMKRLQYRNNCLLKRLSRFPRTVVDDNIVESKFFPTSSVREDGNTSKESLTIDESPEKTNNPFKISSPDNNLKETLTRNPFKVNKTSVNNDIQSPDKDSIIIGNDLDKRLNLSNGSHNSDIFEFNSDHCDKTYKQNKLPDLVNDVIIIDEELNSSQKENSPCNSPIKKPHSPILGPSPRCRNLFGERMFELETTLSEDSVVENTYPMETLVTPLDSQESFGRSPPKNVIFHQSQPTNRQTQKKSTCRVSGLRRTVSLNNQPTLLSKFGFQKKSVLKR